MQQVIQGQVTTLEERQGGWVAVHVLAPGNQYPTKLSTKRPEIIDDARSLMGQMVDAAYNEQESQNINPHTQQPYINRYLEAIGPLGSQPAQPQEQPQQQGPLAPEVQAQAQAIQQAFAAQQQKLQPFAGQPTQSTPAVVRTHVTDTEREMRIMRQTATKVAGIFLAYLPEGDRTLGELVRISEQLMKYYREGVSWNTNPVDVGSPPNDEPPQDSDPDDGIPF